MLRVLFYLWSRRIIFWPWYTALHGSVQPQTPIRTLTSAQGTCPCMTCCSVRQPHICPMHIHMHDVLLRASSTHVLTSHWTLPIRYSLLWNLPSTGHVTLPAGGGHTWHGDAVPHLSFWVTTTAAPAPALALAPADADAPADAQATSTAPKPPPKESHWAERMRKYTAVTGRAPLIGGFMSGYWQSRNR
jgi:hypothetical protein